MRGSKYSSDGPRARVKRNPVEASKALLDALNFFQRPLSSPDPGDNGALIYRRRPNYTSIAALCVEA